MPIAFDPAMRLLVVDDFESMRKLIIKNLQQLGFSHFEQASNGREALKLLESRSGIQMLISDWNMPVMNGLELLQAIRAHPTLNRLPVLMVTAEAGRGQVTGAAEAGVSDFLVKPFTVGGLQAKIDRILGNLAKGKVVGAPGSGLKAESPFEAKAEQVPAPAPVAEVAIEEDDGPTLIRDVPESASVSAAGMTAIPIPPNRPEPPALQITEDLQAKLTMPSKVLVVDDVADNIEILVGMLQEEYKVQAARSGAAALKLLSSTRDLPDLILLDVMMPEMDGFEVCRKLKANPATAAIPVIFLTAADDSQNVVQGLELGAVDYVSKPANPAVLKLRVRTHLTRARALRELRKQNKVLNENLRLREEMESIARHDMKNPIGGILNFADMLLAERNALDDEQRDMIGTIADSARLLLHMVNLSLDLVKIEQGTYQLQAAPLDLPTVLRRNLADLAAEIDTKKLTVNQSLAGAGRAGTATDDIKLRVMGDELLCYSLFGNLLKNAVEAAPDGSQLNIAYAAEPAGAGTVSITNDGVVPERIRPRFFAKFATADKQGGTGLGTYSAKLLTEVQGGRISMQTWDRTGQTTLAVSLPRPEQLN